MAASATLSTGGPEFREMKMQPSLERASRSRGNSRVIAGLQPAGNSVLTARKYVLCSCSSESLRGPATIAIDGQRQFHYNRAKTVSRVVIGQGESDG